MKTWHWIAILVVAILAVYFLGKKRAGSRVITEDKDQPASNRPNTIGGEAGSLGAGDPFPEITGGAPGKGVSPTVLYGPRVPARGPVSGTLLTGRPLADGNRPPARPRGPEPIRY